LKELNLEIEEKIGDFEKQKLLQEFVEKESQKDTALTTLCSSMNQSTNG